MGSRDGMTAHRGSIRGTCLVVSLILAAALTACLASERGMLVEARARAATEELAGQVLRLHVLADSDSIKDQQVKLKAKEAVLDYLREGMADEQTLDGTREFVRQHLDAIAGAAERAVRAAGSGDCVTARLATEEFPEKRYGDVTFPAGEYEALQISIGKGEGHNWWCCLYPNLCFTDAIHAKVVDGDKQALEDVLDEDAYDMITCTSNFKIKWFLFEGE